MDKSTREVRLAYWKDIVRQCEARPEGQSASQWLADNSIDSKQYYYRLRQIRREAFEELKSSALPPADESPGVTFAEIPMPLQTSEQPDAAGFHADALIRMDAATIAVSNSASAELLSRIIEAVKHAG